MTTSGTSTFDLDNLDIIEDAYEIVGGEGRIGHDMKTARRSLNLLTREWGNRGINMWTLVSGTQPVVAGASALILPTGIIDVIEVAWRTGSVEAPSDQALTRISTSTAAQITEKLKPGAPSQYYVHRTMTPTIRLWPVPVENGTLAYWYLRSIEDVGRYTNTMDVPGRFLPALIYGLAYYLAMKMGSPDKISIIQQEYERQFMLAAEEDRDRASFRMVPDLSSYNR